VIDVEQARIAAEVEHKRLADQEALKLVVDRAVQIAVVETNKIKENQATEEDVVMLDQN
jgi:D-ribose pyranose/furanose isomerase RbsD